MLLIPIVACASCSRRTEGGYDTLRLVDELVADSLPSLQRLAREAGKPSGAIALIGDPHRCLALSETLMNFDEFDNVDAKRVKDGLPDFSGETVVSVLDFACSPYDSLALTEEGRLSLREITVRNALAALDTSVRCKLLVICSSHLASNGGGDVTDLFDKIGCDVPVVCSADTAFGFPEACFRILRERNLFTHNIAYPTARLLMTVPDQVDPPFSTISFEDSLVPESFVDTVGVIAPNTYVSYVQNKH